MKVLSTLAFLAVIIQSTVASSTERKLLRSGYESPIDFSALTGDKSDSTTTQQKDTDSSTGAGLPGLNGVPGLDSITGGEDAGVSKLLPPGLPSTDSLSSITKGAGGLSALTDKLPIGGGSGKSPLPTDLSGLTGDGGLGSITKGLTGSGKMPGLDSLPIGGGGGKSPLPTDLSGLTGGSGLGSITKGLTGGGKMPGLDSLPIGGGGKGLGGVTDGLTGLTDGLGLPSTSGGKQAYSSTGDKSGEEAEASSPKTTITKSKSEEESPDQK